MARQKQGMPRPKLGMLRIKALKRAAKAEKAGKWLKLASPLQKRSSRRQLDFSYSQAIVPYEYSSALVPCEGESAIAVVPDHSYSSPPDESTSIPSESMANLVEALEGLVRTGLLAWKARVELENVLRENADAIVMPPKVAEAEQQARNAEVVDWYQWVGVLDMFAELHSVDPYEELFAPYMSDPFNPSMPRSCSSHPIMCPL